MDWLAPIREVFEFIFPFFERLLIIRAILGFILVFFLPGFAWTLIFFRRINVIERVALSLALSIVVVTLSLLLMNRLVGIRITGFNSVLVIIVVTILPVAAYYLSRFIKRRRDNDTEGEVLVVEVPPTSPVEDATTEGIEETVTEEAPILSEEVTT